MAVHIDVADALGKDAFPDLEPGPCLFQFSLGGGNFFFRRLQFIGYGLVVALSCFELLLDGVKLVIDTADDSFGLGLLLAFLRHPVLDVRQLILQVFIFGQDGEVRRQ